MAPLCGWPVTRLRGEMTETVKSGFDLDDDHLAFREVYFILQRRDAKSRAHHFQALNLAKQRQHEMLVAVRHHGGMKRPRFP